MELIGVPWIIIIGPKLAAENMVEVIKRQTGERRELSIEAAKSLLVSN